MSKNTSLGLLYYLRKDKINKDNEAPIYLRITIDGARANISTNRAIKPERWNDEADKARGSNEESKSLNQYLDSLKNKVYEKHSHLLDKGKSITAETLRNAVLGIGDKKRSLIEVFDYHNDLMKQKVGIDCGPATLAKYIRALQLVKDFLIKTYRVSDRNLDELNYKFITDFEHYLKTIQGCNHNTTIKYIGNLRKVVNIAVANDWLIKDPFLKFKPYLQEVEFVYLSTEELQQIQDKKIKIPRLDMVRDVFVFSCFTGFAYSDVEKLTPKDIVKGIDGNKWIYTYRTKTEVKSNVPLLPEALALIEKYKNFPENQYTGKLLPVISNQKMNAYLKELADICGIEKNLTFHVARKTFATTICLNNNVPIETVSKMIGHSNINTTQKSYAKVLEKKVSSDMLDLKKKLYGKKRDLRQIKNY